MLNLQFIRGIFICKGILRNGIYHFSCEDDLCEPRDPSTEAPKTLQGYGSEPSQPFHQSKSVLTSKNLICLFISDKRCVKYLKEKYCGQICILVKLLIIITHHFNLMREDILLLHKTWSRTQFRPAPLEIHLWDEVNLACIIMVILDIQFGIEIWPPGLTDSICFEWCFKNIPLDGTDLKICVNVYSNVRGQKVKVQKRNLLQMSQSLKCMSFPLKIQKNKFL